MADKFTVQFLKSNSASPCGFSACFFFSNVQLTSCSDLRAIRFERITSISSFWCLLGRYSHRGSPETEIVSIVLQNRQCPLTSAKDKLANCDYPVCTVEKRFEDIHVIGIHIYRFKSSACGMDFHAFSRFLYPLLFFSTR